ncbi:MAG: SNF2 helicase associated domain-containing protein, partial [Clostridium sp.]
MVYGILLTTFLKSVKGKNEKSGERVYNNDLVLSPEIIIDENNIIIHGRVISESLYSEYSSKIYINTKGELYSPPVCTCNDYEKRALKHSFFACKHINAQFLYFLNMLQRDDTLYSLFKNDEEALTTESSSMEILDVLAPSEKKEKIKFEVYINRREFDRNIYVYFKIGSRDMKSSSLYTLKDIDAFLTYINNNIPLKYGKDFILDLSTQEMNGEALNILSFIKLIKNLDSSNTFKRSQDKYIQGKFLFIPKAMVRSFLEGIQNTRIYLEEGFFYRPVESEVIKSNIPVSFLIRESENEIILEIHGPTPKELNENGDGYLYNGSIYLPTYDQVKSISPYLKLYNDVKGICFPKSQEETVLRRIIPSVQRISNDVILDNKLKDRVVLVKPKYKFYFDRDKEIKLTYKVDYNGIEFNYFHEFTDKIIFRDTVNENKVFNLIESIGLTVIKDYFVFNINDEDIYSFFLGEIEKLQDVGEVFYSQHFKGIKLLNSSNFNVTVRKGKHNYFNFEFNIDSISDKEFRRILRAFRNNKKYYKLDNGEFINLEELELNKLLILINNCTKDIENTTIMDLNKAPYFSEYVDKYNLNYFSGLTALKKVYKKFN